MPHRRCQEGPFPSPIPFNVERNIRTIIQQAWRKDPAKLREMAGYTLFTYPKVSEFIEIIAREAEKRKKSSV